MSCNQVSRPCTEPQVDEVQLTRRFFGVRIPFGSNRTPTCTSSADLGDKPTQRCNLRAQVARTRGPSARGQFHPCGSVGGTVSGYQPMSRKASVPPRCGNAGVLSCGSIATPRRYYSPSTYRGRLFPVCAGGRCVQAPSPFRSTGGVVPFPADPMPQVAVGAVIAAHRSGRLPRRDPRPPLSWRRGRGERETDVTGTPPHPVSAAPGSDY